MPRISKFEDVPYEKITHSGKIFIYNSPEWNILYPIVNIIRLLKQNTIIGHKYGKGQIIVKTYSDQYFHRTIGYDLKYGKDYTKSIVNGMVSFIFVFTDSCDPVATNLIDLASKYKINIICYSNLDSVYHFYDYSDLNTVSKTQYKTADETVELMYQLMEMARLKKIDALFPEFEIIDHPKDKEISTLEECVNIINKSTESENTKKDSIKIKVYDSNLSNIKKMEYQRSQRNLKFDDDLDIITHSVKQISLKNVDPIKKNLLSKFFKKK